MATDCICDGVVLCAHHGYLLSLQHICLRCGHKRGDHIDPVYNSTECAVTGGCAARCNGFVTLDDIALPRGPQPPTEEAIIEARTTAGIKLRRAVAASHIDSRLMDEALEAVAEFVRLRNYV